MVFECHRGWTAVKIKNVMCRCRFESWPGRWEYMYLAPAWAVGLTRCLKNARNRMPENVQGLIKYFPMPLTSLHQSRTYFAHTDTSSNWHLVLRRPRITGSHGLPLHSPELTRPLHRRGYEHISLAAGDGDDDDNDKWETTLLSF